MVSRGFDCPQTGASVRHERLSLLGSFVELPGVTVLAG